MGTDKEARISELEEWVVELTQLLSETLPPAYAEDLQQITMRRMDKASQVKQAKFRGETLTDD